MQRFWIFAILAAAVFLHSASGAADPITTTPPPTSMGYGMMLMRMVLMLGAVCALATVSLRWGLKRLTHAHHATQNIEVISRAVIEPRRAVLILRIGTRHLIVGTGEHGMTPLGELSAEEALSLKVQNQNPLPQKNTPSFQKIFANIIHPTDSKITKITKITKKPENVQPL